MQIERRSLGPRRCSASGDRNRGPAGLISVALRTVAFPRERFIASSRTIQWAFDWLPAFALLLRASILRECGRPIPLPRKRDRSAVRDAAQQSGTAGRLAHAFFHVSRQGIFFSALLEFVEMGGPIVLEQSRKRAIGEDLSASLATGAIVRLVVGIANPLHRRTAHRTGLPVLSVNGHLRSKRRHALGKAVVAFGAEALGPLF